MANAVVHGTVSEDFRRMVLGYGLTFVKVFYYRPDHAHVLQEFSWQTHDLYPQFPRVMGFLEYWEKNIHGRLHSVEVAHARLIKPTEFRAVDGYFRLN